MSELRGRVRDGIRALEQSRPVERCPRRAHGRDPNPERGRADHAHQGASQRGCGRARSRRRRITATLLAALLLGTVGSRQPIAAGRTRPPAEPAQDATRGGGGPFPVAEVARADTLVLGDGRRVRLAGIVVPGTIGAAEPAAERIAQAARDLLLARLAGASTLLKDAAPDRHGRIMAQVHGANGGWIQEELVTGGLAWVAPEGLDERAAGALLAAEATARARAAGLWAVPSLGLQPAEHVASAPPRYAVVTGRVREASRQERYVYLNFGQDWRRDFTARVPSERTSAIKRAGLDPEDLAGHVIVVRGWLFEANGPMIEVSAARQIEVIE